MTSMALDFATIGRALQALSAAYLDDSSWQPATDDQHVFLEWFATHRKELSKLTNLESLASGDFAILNSFLVVRGFQPLFEPFDGIGVVSVLDMLVEWLTEADLTTIEVFNRSTMHIDSFPAFWLPSDGITIYDVEGCPAPLAQLRTKSGVTLWLTMDNRPESSLDLALDAQRISTAARRLNTRYALGAKIPMLDLDVQSDLEWLMGMFTEDSPSGYHEITQAFQQFKLAANQKGAHIKVASGIAATRSAAPMPSPLIFNRPFIGFFTQPEHDHLPIAAFWADFDSWKNPGGTLDGPRSRR
jgi:hypothetical protein